MATLRQSSNVVGLELLSFFGIWPNTTSIVNSGRIGSLFYYSYSKKMEVASQRCQIKILDDSFYFLFSSPKKEMFGCDRNDASQMLPKEMVFECTSLDWIMISLAIFGRVWNGVKMPGKRVSVCVNHESLLQRQISIFKEWGPLSWGSKMTPNSLATLQGKTSGANFGSKASCVPQPSLSALLEDCPISNGSIQRAAAASGAPLSGGNFLLL